MTGAELATATGVYVAADTARKRDLRDRYAFRPAEPAPDGGDDHDRAHERPSIVMTAPTQSEVTARAVAFVAERRDPAEALGTSSPS